MYNCLYCSLLVLVSETKDTVISNYVFEGIAEKADFNTAEVKNSSEELC